MENACTRGHNSSGFNFLHQERSNPSSNGGHGRLNNPPTFWPEADSSPRCPPPSPSSDVVLHVLLFSVLMGHSSTAAQQHNSKTAQ